MTTTVVHCKKEPYDIYIGRPSKWGNPFVLGMDGNRIRVIERYRLWLYERPHLMEQARIELKDKVLGCWCAPRICHGDLLCEIANGGVINERSLYP